VSGCVDEYWTLQRYSAADFPQLQIYALPRLEKPRCGLWLRGGIGSRSIVTPGNWTFRRGLFGFTIPVLRASEDNWPSSGGSSLHVLQISFYLDPLARRPAELLKEWPTLVDVAEAVAQAGARVSVIQACSTQAEITLNDVSYYFVRAADRAPSLAQSARFAELLHTLAPDVIHVHGLGFPQDVAALAAMDLGIPVVIQDHADQVPRIWHRSRWRRGLAAASGVLFTGAGQAEPFRKAGLIHPQVSVFDIPESSSRFSPGSQDEARRITGLHGDPCLLWVGHLNKNKDPLTVLDGVREASQKLSGLRLWCCFGVAPLLGAVRDRIRREPLLAERVQLMGRVTHPQIEWLMRAADLFVLGSLKEGSGYALIEALACGLPPIVTDIPSFSSLTAQGRIGALWPKTDARGLCEALVRLAAKPRGPLRAAARTHFEQEISFTAIGRKLLAAYDQVVASKQRSEQRSPTPSMTN
jgi:glycosyltransferase involved in cell wall biosynthesis